MITQDKTRNLSMFDYFNSLQKEYVIAELRKKIYPLIKDKNFYERVMEGKRKKIGDIAERNKLSSIFTDEDIKKNIYNSIYKERGLPLFFYKTEEQKKELGNKDISNYFFKGSPVKFFTTGRDDLYYTGEIVNYDFEKKIVQIEYKDSTIGIQKVSIKQENVVRIL